MRKIRETPSDMYMALSNELFPPPGNMSDGSIIWHVDTGNLYLAQSSIQPQVDRQVPGGGWMLLSHAVLTIQLPGSGTFGGSDAGGVGTFQASQSASSAQQTEQNMLLLILRELQLMNLLIHQGFTTTGIVEDMDRLREAVTEADPFFTLT